MGGPVYHYDATNPSTTKFPAYWDNKAFFAEFSQDYVARLRRAVAQRSGRPHRDFLPNAALETERPADQGQPDGHGVRP